MVAIGEELGLVVNAKEAGRGKVSCVVIPPDGGEMETKILDNEDGTFDIFYVAETPGDYIIHVRFGGENIPHSPFKVTVSLEESSWLQWLKLGREEKISFGQKEEKSKQLATRKN